MNPIDDFLTRLVDDLFRDVANYRLRPQDMTRVIELASRVAADMKGEAREDTYPLATMVDYLESLNVCIDAMRPHLGEAVLGKGMESEKLYNGVTMTTPSIIYWERHWGDTRPAAEAQWAYLIGCRSHDYHFYHGYENMVRSFSEYWRRYYDEAEGGDLADWLLNGPFNVMRYYVTDNGRPRR